MQVLTPPAGPCGGPFPGFIPGSRCFAPPLPAGAGRSEHGAGLLNGKVYVVGGKDVNGVALNSVWEFTPVASATPCPMNGTWVQVASLPTARRQLAVAVVGGNLYAIGGLTAGNTVSSEVDVFNGTTWSTAASLPFPVAAAAASGYHTVVLVAGGDTSGAGTATNQVQLYDPATAAWYEGGTDVYPTSLSPWMGTSSPVVIPNLTYPRYGLTAVTDFYGSFVMVERGRVAGVDTDASEELIINFDPFEWLDTGGVGTPGMGSCVASLPNEPATGNQAWLAAGLETTSSVRSNFSAYEGFTAGIPIPLLPIPISWGAAAGTTQTVNLNNGAVVIGGNDCP